MIFNEDIQKIHWKIKHSHGSTVGLDAATATISKTRDRVVIVNFLALAISCLVIVKMVYINTVDRQFLSDRLDNRVLRTVKLPAIRGSIVDRHNTPLAVSTPVDSVWADPSAMTSLTNQQLLQIAQILQIPLAELNIKLTDKHKTFVYLRRGLSPSQIKLVKELKIDGVNTISELKRYYPSGEVTAHVVGFNNIDDKGVDGVEYANNNLLTGQGGHRQIIRDLYGQVVGTTGEELVVQHGNQLQLSIDSRIQYIAYNALKVAVEKHNAKGGSVVVLDAKTGEVLSMVNMPTYNPNKRDQLTPEMLKNRAAVNVFDSGSIMKPLVIAKALDDRVVSANTVFDTGQYFVGPKLIRDDHPRPKMTVAEIIQQSSNVGTSKIALKYSSQQLWEYYRKLGFGQKMNTGFPGETNGILRPWQKWYPIDHALSSFGYGVSVSLFQMAHAYTMFTNNGCILPVNFYKLDSTHSLGCEQVIRPETAKIMREIMSKTTGGAQVNEYTVAGKTGTAQKLDGGKYSNKKHVGSYVGYSPANNPRLIIAVMIDEPKGGVYYGAQVAAPVFSQIVGQSLNVLGVNPDKQVQ